MRRGDETGRRSRLKSAALSFGLTFFAASAAEAITVENVIQMHKSGLPGAVILQTIQSTQSKFNLTVADLKAMEAAGVSKDVVEAMMKAGGSGAPAPEPAPEPAPGPEPTDDLQRVRDAEDKDKAQIEEDDRIREAARRAAELERQKMAAEEQRRVAQALEKARDAFDDGDHYVAARMFDEFIQKSDSASPTPCTP